ncbi:hypothetical protein CC85DRAFT_283973 [Cutaneotrichosporon oleaginosum]|uniref:Uncharacterized protein n=1 Tax=Cutaneotrichosporon oleaginosum TaxID=879819 RepID=A0A0J0XS90_9TREE|nr:uncharacterized protein CC85DRAFT_283973 [Cutaneotrichosporon oleaginosum]KLT43927.1 hypothetical protein CC85DRAFT_283973 [Cutaneotrichosporon oleaginosum]TXT04126.1 hypothetical protein COLE_07823 [Cutaneotrichosporon oleaginosum]
MARKDLLLPPLALDAHTLVLPHPFRLAIDDLAPALSRLVVHAALGRSFNCDKTGWFFPPTLEACVPPWAVRYALHVAVPPDEPELHATRCAFSVSRLHGQDKGEEEEQSARDVVVVFRVSPGRAARAIQPPRPLGILHDFAEAAADHPAWRWTVVGVQEMAEAAPHAVPLQEGVYARFMDVAGPAQVRFCTVAEYARSGEGLLEIGEA